MQAGPAVGLEGEPGGKLDTSRIAYSGALTERHACRGCRDGTCSKGGVRDHIVPVIERIEGFGHPFQVNSLR